MSEQQINLADHGYLPWPGDLSGQTLVAPDGHRILSVEEAIAELTEGRSESD